VFVSNHPRPASLPPHHDEKLATVNPLDLCHFARSLREESALTNCDARNLFRPLCLRGVSARRTRSDENCRVAHTAPSVFTARIISFSPSYACHQISTTPVFSNTYKLPIFYPLCFDTHPCNGGWVPPSPQFYVQTLRPSNAYARTNLHLNPFSCNTYEAPASVANKRLTENLTLLDAILTKNQGEGSPLKCALCIPNATTGRSDV
jgi:hypothetical protein